MALRSVLLCAFVVIAVAFAIPARAAVDVYEVSGIAVDVTADTAAAARDQALVDGEREAFRTLLRRLTLRSMRDRLPDLERGSITRFVRDFSVQEEKTSSVRYLAKLTYRFKRDAIRAAMSQNGVPFAETPSKPLLVLPVFESAGARSLWDDPNPWRVAWQELPKSDGLVPLVVPIGDLSDIAAIGVQQAMNGDGPRLDAIARKYGAADVMVVHGVLGTDPVSGRSEIRVTGTRYGSVAGMKTIVRNFVADGTQTEPQLMARAAKEVAVEVEEEWKGDNLLRFQEVGVLSAVVPIQALKDWLTVKERLGRVAVVKNADVVVMSRTEVRLTIHYLGNPDQLALALEQADLTLTQSFGNWILSPTMKATAPQ